MAFVALQMVGLAVIPVITPTLQAQFAFDDAHIGLLTSAFALAVSVTAIPMGLAAGRWGGRTLLVAAALFVAGSLMFAAASSYPWFVAARFLQGLGAGAGLPVGIALLSNLVAPSRRHRAFGIFGLATGIGTVVPLLVMPSIVATGGYRAVFLVVAAAGVAVGAAAGALRVIRARPARVDPQAATPPFARVLGRAAREPRVLLIALMSLTSVAVVVGVLTWTPQFLHDQHGSSLAVAAYMTAGIGLAQIVGNPFGAFAMSRWGRNLVLVLFMALMTVTTAVIPLTPGLVVTSLAVMTSAFLVAALLPPTLGSIAVVVRGPAAVGAASGLVGLLNVGGSMLAPWLFGRLLDTYGTAPGQPGYVAGYLMLAGFALAGTIGAVAFVVLRRSAGHGAAQSRTPAAEASPGPAGALRDAGVE